MTHESEILYKESSYSFFKVYGTSSRWAYLSQDTLDYVTCEREENVYECVSSDWVFSYQADHDGNNIKAPVLTGPEGMKCGARNNADSIDFICLTPVD